MYRHLQSCMQIFTWQHDDLQPLEHVKMILEGLSLPYQFELSIDHPVLSRPHFQVIRGGHTHAVGTSIQHNQTITGMWCGQMPLFAEEIC